MRRGAHLDPFYRLVVLDSVASTNDEAKARAADGATEGTLIWAREQTAGRGRHGRHWSSPPGNLYFSLVLRPAMSVAEANQVSFVAAVALSDCLEALLPQGRRLGHKWPNDVLVEGRKIAGILLESAGGDRLEWLVLGLGVNLASHPQETDPPATSLGAEGVAVTPQALLADLCASLLVWRRRWLEEGFAPVRAAWLARAGGLDGPLRIEVGRDTLAGTFLGLDETGALVLGLPDGGRRSVAAGEVVRARGARGQDPLS